MEQGKKVYLYIIGGLVILLTGVFAWKVLAVRSVEKEMAEQRVQIIEKSQRIIADKTKYFLRLTVMPFTWAIRKEMLRDNYEQINEYLVQFIKEPHVKLIIISGTDGTIKAATDKKMEGQALYSLYPQVQNDLNEIAISDDKKGNILLASPLMGYNKKLGMLLMVYEPDKVDFDGNPAPK